MTGRRKAKSETIDCPFRILVDTAEQQPFTFDGIKANAKLKYRIYEIATRRHCLGRHPRSLGDYSIEDAATGESLNGYVNIERKSVEDLQTTILGFDGRSSQETATGHRDRFESELGNFERYVDSPLVLVEGSFEQVVATAPSYGIKTAQQNARTLFQSILSYQQKHFPRVPWFFAGNRRMAEMVAFHWFRRFHEGWLAGKPQEQGWAKKMRAQTMLEFNGQADPKECAIPSSPLFGHMVSPVAKVVEEEIEL